MKDKVKALIIKLENENNRRAEILSRSYNCSNLEIEYNNTLDIIKQLKEILLSV